MDGVISLGIGEPDFITPWHIRNAGIMSLEKGRTQYTSNAGLVELKQEVANYMKRRFDLSYEPNNQVLITVGGSEAIDLAIRAIVEPGDEVLIPIPCFVCYDPITRLAGGVPVLLETKAEDNFKLTPELLKKNVTDKTKALILPFPNNPTGAIMDRKDLEAIAEVLRDTNIMIISDEIYAELTYTDERHVSIAEIDGMYDRTVVINGFSKAYAMTGWRLGFACGHPDVIGPMIKIHQYAIMCAPTTSQYAAIEALRFGDKDIEDMKTEYNYRRKLIVNGFNKMGLDCFEPMGAFYCFPSIKRTGLSSEEFCEKLLLEEKIALVPGVAFGRSGEGHLRVSYAYSVDHIKKALEGVKRFISKYI
ncbi:MAG: aminotransferase class I/II-fold pyridoxal phosphate-dependent enzyme [Clostridiaceae bacterium]|nr:aminotransferase class I/II-fold pyridoxal phosphate-dependent enzyme [Clostridiaceae bacterium]